MKQLLLLSAAIAASVATGIDVKNLGPRTPEAEGVPSKALVDFMADLERLDHPRDFCVMRHGKWVTQGSWRGVSRG